MQTHAPHSTVTHSKREVVHTNQKHPFLMVEHGFLPVAHVKVGMHVERADGTVGIVSKWQIVPGISMMYNLEVAQDHTFTVGAGQWIVHNCDVFSNHYPDKLTSELELAKNLGVKPISVGDPGFQEMIQSGPVKWAVSTDHELAFIPKYVGGVEINHTVINGGKDVLAAGEAEIYNSGSGYVASNFNNWSGHYTPSDASTVIGRQAFTDAGIRFPPPISGLRW